MAMAIFYFPCFLQLKKVPIRLWDESRLALNAAEMNETGFSLITTFMGKPDMWNTKPPLMIWLQVLCMKIVGVNELAVRLPSAIAGFLTCVFLLGFIWKKFKNPLWSFMSAMILLSSGGYVAFHVLRTGDYDALLILFTTSFSILYYEWLNKKKPSSLIILVSILILLAILTKGIACIMVMPGILIWTLYQKKIIDVFINKKVWMGASIIIIGAALFYILREQVNPGYLKAVWENELGGRFATTLEDHKHPFYYYTLMFFNVKEFFYWWVFLIAGIFWSLKRRASVEANFIHFLAIVSLFFLLTISVAQTKIEWYKAPLFPWFSIIAAYGFMISIEEIIKLINQKTKHLKLAVAVVFLLFAAIPYGKTVKFAYQYDMPEWEKGYYGTSFFIKHALKNNISLDGYKIALQSYNPHFKFYEYVLKHQGQKVEIHEPNTIYPKDKVLADMHEMKLYIDSTFNYKLLYEYQTTRLYELGDYK